MPSTPHDHADDLLAEDLRVYRSWLEQAETVEGRPALSTAVPAELSTHLAAGRQCLELLHAVRRELPCGDAVPVQIGYSAPAQIGGFQITGPPRVGGFGIVFPARDPEMHRAVAIKVPKPEFLGSPDFIERFTREAQTVAQLDHRNIVPVFACGKHGVTPYLVMPFIRGQTLAAWRASQSDVAPRVAAEIIRQLAEGVAHAHAHDVLHRDIKPGNILLEQREASADNDQAPFQPKLTDFGLAKFLDDVHPPTQTGTVLGTLGYMSPEQSAGRSSQVGFGSDVYSLGAVFYFIMTGEPPAPRGANPRDDRDDPPELRRRGFQIPIELELICQKCLERSPERRYASARLLADDLRRFLAGEPILARPISPLRRCGKRCRRHPAWATLLSVTALSVLSLVAVSLWYNGQLSEHLQISEQARLTAEAHEREMRRRAYVSDMALASRAWNSGNVSQTLSLLDRYRPENGESDLRDFAWHYLWRQYADPSKILGRHEGGATAVAMTGDGTWGVSAGKDGAIRLWSLPQGTLETTLHEHAGIGIRALEFSPRGNQLAAAGDEGTVRVWEIPSRRLLHELTGHQGQVNDVAYSPDGTLLATGGEDQIIQLWNPETGQPLGALRGHAGMVERLAFHPDSQTLASTSKDSTLRLWDARQQVPDTRVPEGVLFKTSTRWPRTLAFSPDGNHLAVGTSFATVVMFDFRVETFGLQKPVHPELIEPGESVRAMIWPHQEMLAAGTMSILLADPFYGHASIELKGHTDSVLSLASTQNGSQLLSGSDDGDVRHWAIQESRNRLHSPDFSRHKLPLFNFDIGRVCLSDRLLLTIPSNHLFDLSQGAFLRAIPPLPGTSARQYHLSHRGSSLLMSFERNILACQSVETGERLWTRTLPSQSWVQEPVFAGDSAEKWIAVPSEDNALLISQQSGEIVRCLRHPSLVSALLFLELPGHPVTLITASKDGSLRFWDISTGTLQREHFAHAREITALALSADRSLLATGGADRTVRVWKTDDLTQQTELGRGEGILRLGFFSSRNYLVCGDQTISLWDLEHPTEILHFSREYEAGNFAISPDGKILAISKTGQVDLIRDEPSDGQGP